MSLQVWLPLNGNLYNQGLENISVSNSGMTYTDGKITNKAGYFASGKYASINTKNLSSNFSISVWVKPDNNNNGLTGNIIENGVFYLRNGASWGNYLMFYVFTKKNDGTYDGNAHNIGALLTANVWTHICITKELNIVRAYINGNLVSEITKETAELKRIDNNFSICSSNNRAQSICDIRIYDEVLSPFRIKELSKGLSLHYKLSSPANAMTSEGDCSGHGDDGSFNGAKPAVETDTPRNSRCYNFGAATSKMILSKYKHSWTTNFTASVWAKLPNSTSSANYIFTEGRADAVSYGFGIQCTNSSFTARFGNGSIGASNFTANTWHHLALVVDNTSTASFYVDGVLKGSNKPGTLPTYTESNGLGIGGFRYASGNIYPHNGCISDFRLYATALSEKDIKELYNTPITIDDKDVLYGNDFVEEETPVDMKFYKTGVIKKELNYKTTTGYNPKDFIEV